MVYWAHSENEDLKKHTLKDHLTHTAEFMEKFCTYSKYRNLFHLAGLLHDFGKYQISFQQYLENGGRKGSVPHAIFGAAWLYNIAKRNKYKTLEPLLFSIAGHHKGLPNQAELIQDLKDTDEVLLENLSTCFNKDIQENIETLLSEIQNLFTSSPDTLVIETLTRYIFSALTDADWLDTERHFSNTVFLKRKNLLLNAEEKISILEKYILQFDNSGKINELRNSARLEAVENAKTEIGFFSLSLPTGMGKTLISLSWALHHALQNKLQRIFIVLPYCNIIDQTAQLLKTIFGEDSVLEHHSGFNLDFEKENENQVDLSTYSLKLASENWDFPIVVTTTVQFFESLFSNKSSKCRKIHNLAESIVIFDEVQTLPKKTITATLTMLENLSSVMRMSFLFCTATQPAFCRKNGIQTITPLIANPKHIYQAVKRVKYDLIDNLSPISIEAAVKRMIENRTSVLSISNLKKEAFDIFEELKRSSQFDAVYHLSTAMCAFHRKETLRNIKNSDVTTAKIAVSSTQLIEAGVDLDFPCVFRTLSPLESLIQAAGRCNRNGKMEKLGKVFIYCIDESRMPDMEYEACAKHTKFFITEDLNRLDTHDSYSKYYDEVMSLYINSNINTINEDRKKFRFESVCQSYRIIDSPTQPLFIAEYNEISREIYKEILQQKYNFRKMQPYLVHVYQNFIEKHNSLIEVYHQSIFIWKGPYSTETGLLIPESADNDFIV